MVFFRRTRGLNNTKLNEPFVWRNRQVLPIEIMKCSRSVNTADEAKTCIKHHHKRIIQWKRGTNQNKTKSTARNASKTRIKKDGKKLHDKQTNKSIR